MTSTLASGVQNSPQRDSRFYPFRGTRKPLALLLVTLMSGCAATRLTQFHNFSEAGSAYVKASQVVLDEAGTAAIDADSLISQQGRDGLQTAEERRKSITTSNEELRKRLLILREIGRHERLLQSYFETLGALADSNAPSTLGTAAEGVFDSISKLSPTIKNASLGGVKIENHIPQATSFVVQSFKVKALEKELKARSVAIEREIALEEAAFKVIADNLQTDLTVQLQLEETQDVIEPYANPGALPPRWPQRRNEILQATVAAQSAQSAAGAAAKLRESFIALVENRLSEPSISQVIAAINSMLDLVQQIQKASPAK